MSENTTFKKDLFYVYKAENMMTMRLTFKIWTITFGRIKQESNQEDMCSTAIDSIAKSVIQSVDQLKTKAYDDLPIPL